MFIWFRARQVCCVSVCFHSFLQGHTEPCLVWMHRKRNLTASASIRTFRKKQACMRSKQVEPSVALYMRCKKVEPSVASSMQAAQARVVEPSRASNMFALSASWTFRSIRHVCNGKECDYHPNPTQHTAAQADLPINPTCCFLRPEAPTDPPSLTEPLRGDFGCGASCDQLCFVYVCFPKVTGWIYRVQHITCNIYLHIYIYSWRNLMYLTSNRV